MKKHITKFLDKLNNPHTLFIIGLIILTVLTGYTYGKHDQALYIPLVNKILDPSLHTRDAFQHFFSNESANFLKLLAPFFRTFGVEAGFFILYYIGYSILVLASYLMGKEIFKSRNAGYVFALVVLASRMPYLTPETFFATRELILPLLLIAVYFFIKGSYKLSYLLIGILANFHQISAVPLIMILFFVHLVFIKSIGIKKTVICILLFLLGFIPTIIQILLGTGTKIVLTADIEWYKLQRILTNGNYSIFYPEGEASTKSFLLILLGTFTIFLLLRKYRSLLDIKYQQGYDKLSLLLLFTIIFLFVVAVIYRVYPSVILVQLQLIRATSYLTIFSALGLGAAIYLLCTNNKITKLQGVVSFMIFYLLSAIGSAVFLILAIHKFIPKLITYVFIVLGIWMLGQMFLLTRGLILPEGQFSLYIVDQEFIDLQLWMRNNTPVTSLFLAPTYTNDISSGNIRVISQRNILFTPSELWMNIIDYKHYPNLVSLLDDLSNGKATEAINTVDGGKLFYDVITKSYYDLTEAEVLRLKQTYGLDYFIVESKFEYSFDQVYSNSEYRVYKL